MGGRREFGDASGSPGIQARLRLLRAGPIPVRPRQGLGGFGSIQPSGAQSQLAGLGASRPREAAEAAAIPSAFGGSNSTASRTCSAGDVGQSKAVVRVGWFRSLKVHAAEIR